ncbi:MAG: hypothetical protein R3A10_23960, partial [Caldilineaceae bacterium]
MDVIQMSSAADAQMEEKLPVKSTAEAMGSGTIGAAAATPDPVHKSSTSPHMTNTLLSSPRRRRLDAAPIKGDDWRDGTEET